MTGPDSNHGDGPRRARPFVVFAFRSARLSLAAEETLRADGLDIRVMPLPRHRGELCGIALRLEPQDESNALMALGAAGIEVASRDEITDL
jgi:hypothetical protein